MKNQKTKVAAEKAVKMAANMEAKKAATPHAETIAEKHIREQRECEERFEAARKAKFVAKMDEGKWNKSIERMAAEEEKKNFDNAFHRLQMKWR